MVVRPESRDDLIEYLRDWIDRVYDDADDISVVPTYFAVLHEGGSGREMHECHLFPGDGMGLVNADREMLRIALAESIRRDSSLWKRFSKSSFDAASFMAFSFPAWYIFDRFILN